MSRELRVPTTPSGLRNRILARGWVVLAGGLVALGMVRQFSSSPSPDVAWYLYAAGRLLDGDRLYTDIVELNPPLIIWLNVPAVWLAHQVGIESSTLYRGMVGVGALVSVLLSWLALRSGREFSGSPARLLLLLLTAVLFVVVSDDFGQREHLLLILILPYLFLAAGRNQETTAGSVVPVVSGVLAGIGIALKPHFVLLSIAVEVGHLVNRQKVLRPDMVALTAVVVGYWLGLTIWFPEYFVLLRHFGTVYFQFVRQSLVATALVSDGAAVALCAILASIALRRVADWHGSRRVFLLATVALYAIAVLQQKGWAYHFYPAVGTGLILLLLLWVDAVDRPAPLVGRIYRAVAVALVLYLPTVQAISSIAVISRADRRCLGSDPEYGPLAHLVRELGPGRTVLAISGDLAAGFPLVLETHSRWASRYPSMWILQGLYQERVVSGGPRERLRVRQQNELEREVTDALLEDFDRGRPDVLLIAKAVDQSRRSLDYLRYLGHQPAFAQRLRGYAHVGDVGRYRVLMRTAVQAGLARSALAAAGPVPRGIDVAHGVELAPFQENLILRILGFGVLVAILFGAEPSHDLLSRVRQKSHEDYPGDTAAPR